MKANTKWAIHKNPEQLKEYRKKNPTVLSVNILIILLMHVATPAHNLAEGDGFWYSSLLCLGLKKHSCP